MPPERVVIVASTVNQFELAREQLRLPRSRARFAVCDVHLKGCKAEEIVLATPCLTRSGPGADRYWGAVEEARMIEARDGIRVRWVAT